MKSFSKKIESFNKKALGEAEEISRAAGLALFRAVIMDTPVDKGQLVGNWIASSDMPDFAITNISGQGAPAKAIAAAMPIIDGFKLGDTLYLTNSMPYAYRIEYEGYSKTKAPQGMVRRNVQRIAENLRRGGY